MTHGTDRTVESKTLPPALVQDPPPAEHYLALIADAKRVQESVHVGDNAPVFE